MRADHPQHHVVVEDPEGQYWEGALVSAENDAPLIRRRGGITLPIEQDLVAYSAVGGYFRRSWGSGWPLGTAVPRRCCPMMLYIGPVNTEMLRSIHCAVRIVPDSDQVLRECAEKGGLPGNLRLSTDTGQPGVFGGGFGATERTCAVFTQLGKPDSQGGWNLYLAGTVNAPANSLVGYCLYGAAPGLRVAWAAISQSR